MDEGARFPRVRPRAGHYESFYVKACPPGGGRGVWIRHTVHKRPGAEPTASIWFVLFDREAAAPLATKVTVGAAELSTPPGSLIRVAGAELAPGRAWGGLATDALAASWELGISALAPPCRYLPAEWLYRSPLPRTKFVAPIPAARLDGEIEVAGDRIEVDGWSGMVGHNWGSEHAERWVWLEGTGFGGSPGDYFDAGAARVALGSRVSPWIPSGMLVLDGEEHRLGGLGDIRSARVEAAPGACEFVLGGRDVVVRGSLTAPVGDFVGWVYADPGGSEHHTINCSVADLELTVERPGRRSRELRLAAAGAYELGMRETDHGVPIQPYPDG